MSDIPSAYERMATAPCPGFQWLGQSMWTCDRCSKPYWEHSHDEHFKDFDQAILGRVHRIVITTKGAEKIRRKWGR